MAEQALSYSQFPLLPLAATNDGFRPGSLILEYFEVDLTVSSNLGEAEVPTALGSVIGVISLGFMGTFAAGDTMHGMSTDCVITTGAVTVRATTVSISDGALTVRGFLVGTKSETALSF